MSRCCKKLLKYLFHLKDPVVRDYSYSRWAPHYFAISAISSEGLIANWLLKNPEDFMLALLYPNYLPEYYYMQ